MAVDLGLSGESGGYLHDIRRQTPSLHVQHQATTKIDVPPKQGPDQESLGVT